MRLAKWSGGKKYKENNQTTEFLSMKSFRMFQNVKHFMLFKTFCCILSYECSQ